MPLLRVSCQFVSSVSATASKDHMKSGQQHGKAAAITNRQTNRIDIKL